MKKNKQVTPAPNWDAIFKKRPDLESPGYREVCAQLKQEKESNHEVS
jgi:hypothetical protein